MMQCLSDVQRFGAWKVLDMRKTSFVKPIPLLESNFGVPIVSFLRPRKGCLDSKLLGLGPYSKLAPFPLARSTML